MLAAKPEARQAHDQACLVPDFGSDVVSWSREAGYPDGEIRGEGEVVV